MKRFIIAIIIALLTVAMLSPGFGADKKLAQTGFQFLSVVPQARAAAMGEAYTTIDGQSSSLFFNPANLARTQAFIDIGLNQQSWIADIDYLSASFLINPARGAWGTFGVSIVSVNYGDVQGTMVDPSSDLGYVDTDIYTPSAYAVGFGYAKSLTDRFSVGGQVKYATQSIGSNLLPILDDEDNVVGTEKADNTLGVMAFDFGTIYVTGFKSLVFGMSVTNFSQEVKFENESFQLPLTFRMGISMDLYDLVDAASENHDFLFSLDALHPRAYSERLQIGAEYCFMNMFALRGGYLYNYDERGLTAGVGVQKAFGNRKIAFDYAYTPFGIFDNVQQLSFRVTL